MSMKKQYPRHPHPSENPPPRSSPPPRRQVCVARDTGRNFRCFVTITVNGDEIHNDDAKRMAASHQEKRNAPAPMHAGE